MRSTWPTKPSSGPISILKSEGECRLCRSTWKLKRRAAGPTFQEKQELCCIMCKIMPCLYSLQHREATERGINKPSSYPSGEKYWIILFKVSKHQKSSGRSTAIKNKYMRERERESYEPLWWRAFLKITMGTYFAPEPNELNKIALQLHSHIAR